MTRTATGLRRLALPHTRARVAGVLLAAAGGALAVAAGAIALAPRPLAVAAGWLALLGVAAAAAWAARRVIAAATPGAVGRLVEQAAGLRAGSVMTLVAPPAAASGQSPALFAAADERAARLVETSAPDVRRTLGAAARRRLATGFAAALAGAMLFVAAAPASGRAAAFWHPLAAWRAAHAPVRLAVDRARVKNGDAVTASVTAPGALHAVLWTRGPGEPWRASALTLDSTGHGAKVLGPLAADLFVKATSGGRTSAELRVAVAPRAFLADLTLTARYPAYLGRPDEPLLAGPDTIPLPEGTAVVAQGTASVALAGAAWQAGARAARLRTDGARFGGAFTPGSGTWRLALAAADSQAFEGETPELHVRVLGDSAPVVTLALPAGDTTLPLSLHQPFVVDARDDHALARLALVSWRVSQTGRVETPVRESLDVAGVGERAIVQGDLDAAERGLLPGDTLRLYVEGWDDAPAPHRGVSRTVALRVPGSGELRAAARAAARDVAAATESVTAAQRDLNERTAELAAQRARDGATTPPTPTTPDATRSGALNYQQSERAQAVAREQAQLQDRIRELTQAVEQIQQAVAAAGLGDSAFQARLAEVADLLRRSLSPDLVQRLRDLQDALSRLDPEATRQALQRLAEAQQQLREQLERTQELFHRAAVEGALSTLAADADDLRRRQEEWNRSDAPRADSAAAANEHALAARGDSLAAGVAQANRDLQQTGGQAASDSALRAVQQAAERATSAMNAGAAAAGRRDAGEAGRQGQEAARQLQELPKFLRAAGEQLALQWRQEALASLDRALSETAALAARQRDVGDALRRGAGTATRGEQASIEEGTTAIGAQIRAAAGRHAMIPPELEQALGFAQHQMAAAREQLDQPQPNTTAAAALADQALEALNATAYALLNARSRVQSTRSGSGLAEAVAEYARLAGQQQGLNGDAQSMLPLFGPGMVQQLRLLAARQQALAQQLERMQGQGQGAGAAELAQEAKDLARQMDAGRLDRQTIARQERLYRRLLDAGRTLTGQEPDEQRERVSRPATGDSVHIPAVLRPGATGSAPALRYPTWEELSRLTPDERRLVLDYFRRLNVP
ncbi:MAG TPA: hypothetical protein VNH63_10795, partial [Gemmatimonadales bacterium]|nr:hypothetical protein [Gemmatimonadales bacterium]